MAALSLLYLVGAFRFSYGDQAKFFEAEVKPRMKHKKKGTVSMANNGDNLHGSQVTNKKSIII